MADDVKEYLAEVPRRIAPVARAAHKVLAASVTTAYVKTIYIGYELDGHMVAALYARERQVEVALALAEDHPSPLLVDASHLTWRTMPVAAVLDSLDTLTAFRALVAEAYDRVATGGHHVMRDNDFFTRAKQFKPNF